MLIPQPFDLRTVHLDVGGAMLRATTASDMHITVAVELREAWSDAVEMAVRSALAEETSFVAKLVLRKWPAIRNACIASSAKAPSSGWGTHRTVGVD